MSLRNKGCATKLYRRRRSAYRQETPGRAVIASLLTRGRAGIGQESGELWGGPRRLSIRPLDRRRMATDLAAVAFVEAKEADDRDKGDQADEGEDDAEIGDGHAVAAGDDREEGGADSDAEAAGELLGNAADAGAAAEERGGDFGEADRVKREI